MEQTNYKDTTTECVDTLEKQSSVLIEQNKKLVKFIQEQNKVKCDEDEAKCTDSDEKLKMKCRELDSLKVRLVAAEKRCKMQEELYGTLQTQFESKLQVVIKMERTIVQLQTRIKQLTILHSKAIETLLIQIESCEFGAMQEMCSIYNSKIVQLEKRLREVTIEYEKLKIKQVETTYDKDYGYDKNIKLCEISNHLTVLVEQYRSCLADSCGDELDDSYGEKGEYKSKDSYGENEGYGISKDSYGEQDGYGKTTDSYGDNQGYGKSQDSYGDNQGNNKSSESYGGKQEGFKQKEAYIEQASGYEQRAEKGSYSRSHGSSSSSSSSSSSEDEEYKKQVAA